MIKKIFTLLILISLATLHAQDFTKETKEGHNVRMEWWRDARFGLFIHWGLYSVPAGEWGSKTNYGEWIRHSAQIPLEEYDKFISRFNPVKFDADEWVRAAKEAGMKYIVITTKHHDGFCLFDSKFTDFDVISTPFKRDILKELSEACKKHDIKLCFYHSIMDWHHPDYLPRRDWEKNRTTDGAEHDRYVQYMKNQLKELLTNYGEIGVLWFDGEWEATWNDKRGLDLYNYVRSLQPDIIINNRVGATRNGLEGFTTEGGFAGDFGTPEQQIPATGLPGADWESCMTMNDNWGYNKNDKNWKTAKEILQMLADIASKGGNYLLNVGPTAEGLFPDESVERLREIGRWMKVNSESIYGTGASPFEKLEWGRCTQKKIENGTRLYLHIFDFPADEKLVIPGIINENVKVYLLSDPQKNLLKTDREDEILIISLPAKVPDEINTVVVLETTGDADIVNPPQIKSTIKIFIDKLNVNVEPNNQAMDVRYTLDGTVPTLQSPSAASGIELNETAVVSTRYFRNSKPVSGTAKTLFTKVKPVSAVEVDNLKNGVHYKYFEGKWETLPDFNLLQPIDEGVMLHILLPEKRSLNNYGVEYTAYIRVPKDDVYTFYLSSDDGSSLYISDKLIIDNDGLHAMIEKEGSVALSAGYHPIRIKYFENTGDEGLKVFYKYSENDKRQIDDNMIFYPAK